MSNDNPHFLVVDDDPRVLELMTAILSTLGCTAFSVDCGKKALEEVDTPEKANRFDAIFLDVVMPEITGYDVAKQIKSMPHAAPIPLVMVSGMDAYNNILNGYGAGAEYYISKPITKEQITYALDLFLSPEEESQKKVFHLPEA